jgi:hypothetical protein
LGKELMKNYSPLLAGDGLGERFIFPSSKGIHHSFTKTSS